MKAIRILIGILVITSSAKAQTQRELYNASLEAYRNKDYKTFLKLNRTLDSLRPFHPTYLYNLASANALNENFEDAIINLRKLVLMNNKTDFDTDEDFKTMRQDQAFKDVISLKAHQSEKISNSKPVVTLSEKDLHPEGLTFLSKTKTWLATSVHKHKIISFDIKTGQCSDWLKDEGILAVMAIKPSKDEQFLWVATSALPEMDGFDNKMEGRAEVLKLDTKSKKIIKRFSMPDNHVFGDLIVSPDGVIYISDSNKPIVYQIRNNAISEFMDFGNDGFNLQGLAFNAEGNKLFVADYLKGIAVIDIKTKDRKWLEFPDDASPKGIDGLVFQNNNLFAIQNGVKPIRIMQFKLNLEQDKIDGFQILDNNRPEFDEPALITFIDGQLYFFANAPWNAYNNGVLDLDKVKNPILYCCKPK